MRIANRTCFVSVSLGLASLLSMPAFGAVPVYSNFQLQARSNLCVNPDGTFNLACDHFFTNGTPVINNHGAWTVKLEVVGATGGQGVLFGTAGGATQNVYTSPAKSILSDPWINNGGLIVFPQTLSAQNSLRQYNTVTQSGGLLTTQPTGASSWGSVVVNDSGQVGFRATFSGSNSGWYSFESSTATPHALMNTLDPRQPYTFLFSPHMNGLRQMAGHVSIGAQDQIRRINADGSSTIIAVDRDTNPASPYSNFDSSRPAIMNDGRVAFIASLFGGGRGVFLSNGTTTLTIATSIAGQGVTDIEFFPPHVNNRGQVVFRGRDAGGLRAIFVGDGATIRRVIGEHDIVPSDHGPARIDQNDNSPVFGGAPTINDCGHVIFHCALTPPDNNQIEWGSGIYIAAPRKGDATGNGTVDVDDLVAVILGWGPCQPMPAACPADFDCSFAVDVDDLITVILNWG